MCINKKVIWSHLGIHFVSNTLQVSSEICMEKKSQGIVWRRPERSTWKLYVAVGTTRILRVVLLAC